MLFNFWFGVILFLFSLVSLFWGKSFVCLEFTIPLSHSLAIARISDVVTTTRSMVLFLLLSSESFTVPWFIGSNLKILLKDLHSCHLHQWLIFFSVSCLPSIIINSNLVCLNFTYVDFIKELNNLEESWGKKWTRTSSTSFSYVNTMH